MSHSCDLHCTLLTNVTKALNVTNVTNEQEGQMEGDKELAGVKETKQETDPSCFLYMFCSDISS